METNWVDEEMHFKIQSRNSIPELTNLSKEVSKSLSKLREMEDKVIGRHLVLRPAVPPSSEDAVGWFGGAPMLPEDTSWPSLDGEDLVFLAQIDMAKLPESAWRGAGPRDGHLVFFIHPRSIKARVLHVRGALVERTGPSPFFSQFVRDIQDTRPNNDGSFIEDHTLFPKWPVALESGLPSQPVRTDMSLNAGDDPDHPYPYPYPYGFGISNRQLHPFDGRTLKILVEEVARAFSGRLALIEKFMIEKKLSANTKDALEALRTETKEAESAFDEAVVRLNPYMQQFDFEKVSPILEEIGELPYGLIENIGDDPFGYAVIHVTLGDAARKLKFHWKGGDYPAALRKRARYAYSSDPDSLPKELRERLEKEFKFLSAYEFGAMSHTPVRDLGVAFDPDSGDHIPLVDEPNEILLELPTSDLVGWMFGDMYSLVFLISHDDLVAGNFNGVLTTVTN